MIVHVEADLVSSHSAAKTIVVGETFAVKRTAHQFLPPEFRDRESFRGHGSSRRYFP
jgi:hypothetical protein